jgi:membrane associated rhomboid family serine protease
MYAVIAVGTAKGVKEEIMNPWICALLITVAGAIGGVVNALLSDNGFMLPRREGNILCPGVLSNILIGAFAAFASWAFYGSGASIELAQVTARTEISLRFSALAGAFLVGVAGARWITNEVDKRLLKESVKVTAEKALPTERTEDLVAGSPRQVLKTVTAPARTVRKQQVLD